MPATDDLSRVSWPLNEDGNAGRLAAGHGSEFLYVRSHGWVRHDGKKRTFDGFFVDAACPQSYLEGLQCIIEPSSSFCMPMPCISMPPILCMR